MAYGSTSNSFARVVREITSHTVSAENGDDLGTISLQEWHRRRAVDKTIAEATVAGSHKQAGLPMDILDCAFIDFHRELRAYAMNSYGLMQHSEAADFHEALSRFFRVHEPTTAP